MDVKPFSEIKSAEEYQWKSKQKNDDKIIISPENLKFLNALHKDLYISVRSKNDDSTLYTLKAYYPRGKIKLSL